MPTAVGLRNLVHPPRWHAARTSVSDPMRPKSWLLIAAALVLLRCAGDDEVHFGECIHADDCGAGQICSAEARCVSVVIDPISDSPASKDAEVPSPPDAAPTPHPPDAAPPPPPASDAAPPPPGPGDGEGKGKGKGKGKGDDEKDDDDDEDDDDGDDD